MNDVVSDENLDATFAAFSAAMSSSSLISSEGWRYSEGVGAVYEQDGFRFAQLELTGIRSIRIWRLEQSITLDARGAASDGDGIEISTDVTAASLELVIDLVHGLAHQPWAGEVPNGRVPIRVGSRHYLFWSGEASIPLDVDDLWEASSLEVWDAAPVTARSRAATLVTAAALTGLLLVVMLAVMGLVGRIRGELESGTLLAEVPAREWWLLGGGAVAVLILWWIAAVCWARWREARERAATER